MKISSGGGASGQTIHVGPNQRENSATRRPLGSLTSVDAMDLNQVDKSGWTRTGWTSLDGEDWVDEAGWTSLDGRC